MGGGAHVEVVWPTCLWGAPSQPFGVSAGRECELVVATSIDALSSSSSKSTPKFHPNSSQNHPRWTPKSIQNRSGGGLGLPRRPQATPGAPKSLFRATRGASGSPLEGPGSPLRVPKSGPRRPKGRPRASRGVPKRPRSTPSRFRERKNLFYGNRRFA